MTQLLIALLRQVHASPISRASPKPAEHEGAICPHMRQDASPGTSLSPGRRALAIMSLWVLDQLQYGLVTPGDTWEES